MCYKKFLIELSLADVLILTTLMTFHYLMQSYKFMLTVLKSTFCGQWLLAQMVEGAIVYPRVQVINPAKVHHRKLEIIQPYIYCNN